MVKKIRRGGKILFWNDKNITSVNIKRKRKNPKYFRLTSDGVVLPCFDGGGLGSIYPPISIWENNRKCNMILHCFDPFFEL